MTIKLPIILSAMIAALAIPGTLASQAGTEEAAPTEAAAPEAAAPEAAAPEAMDAAKEEPKAKKMKKRHGKHHRHHRGGGGQGHSPDKWDQPYDQVQKDGDSSGCSGDSSSDAGKHLPEETPGQKGPRVPAGE